VKKSNGREKGKKENPFFLTPFFSGKKKKYLHPTNRLSYALGRLW
jgi:hypothetical protein